MTPKERVCRAIAHEESDICPYNLSFKGSVREKLVELLKPPFLQGGWISLHRDQMRPFLLGLTGLWREQIAGCAVNQDISVRSRDEEDPPIRRDRASLGPVLLSCLECCWCVGRRSDNDPDSSRWISEHLGLPSLQAVPRG